MADARLWLTRCPVCSRTLRSSTDGRTVPVHPDPRRPAVRCSGSGLPIAAGAAVAARPVARRAA